MAITITQQPTSPNAAYTRLVYVISGSSNTTAPQFEYVMDVYESGSTSLISRVTQTINPAGVAVFDPSRIIQGQLGQDNVWKTELIISGTNTVGTFDFKFGEQYGTSISSSVTVYPNVVTSSIDIIPAVINPNNGISYNFQSSSYISYVSSDEDIALTNDPYIKNTYPYTPAADLSDYVKSVGTGDFETVSTFNNNQDIVTEGLTLFSSIVYIWSTGSISNPPEVLGTGRIYHVSPSVTYSQSGSIPGKLIHLPTGPQNLANLTNYNSPTSGSYPTIGDVFDSNKWAWYNVESLYSGSSNHNVFLTNSHINEGLSDSQYNDVVNYWNSQGASLTDFNNTFRQPTSNREKVRFAFINSFGVWDYVNIYNPVRRSSDIQRENVTLPRVDYSSTLSPYDITRRGEKSYYIEHSDRFTLDTPLIDKTVANWLEELLESPSVYIQRGDYFIPVVITNNSYRHNNDTSRNKLFKYTIEFEPANQPFGEWIPEYATLIC